MQRLYQLLQNGSGHEEWIPVRVYAIIRDATVTHAEFGLPPLAEQSRIVTRVTALRRLCTDLRQRLAERQSVQARLAEALMAFVA